jgi:hypothetical protein
MAKQALLILQEAGSKQLIESKGLVEKSLARQFPDMIFKSFSYEADHPEEVTYHLGQWVKFLAHPNGMPEPQEELTEEQKTFRQEMGSFWQSAKPALRQLAKEIWYSKEQLKRMKEGKDAGQGRISSKSVKFESKQTQDSA